MKQVLYLVLAVSFSFTASRAQLAMNTFLPASGVFSNPANWSFGHIPADNENVKVPAAKVCSVDIVTDVYDTTTFRIYGTLYFICGQKIRLACSSRLIIHEGGVMQGECTGSKLQYCGSYVWDGGDGPVNGFVSFPGLGSDDADSVNLFFEELTSAHRINWNSYPGNNISQYIVERGTDGQTFIQIGTVIAEPASSMVHDYSFTDYDVESLTGQKEVYYRISWRDEYGNQETGPVSLMKLKKNALGELKIYPNPVKSPVSSLTLELPDDMMHKFFNVSVIDNSGRIVGEIKVSSWDESNKIDISSEIADMNLSPATYFLSFPGGQKQTLVVN